MINIILISACLLGIRTKYNGGSNTNELLLEYCKYGKLLPICPEQIGGLSTPRYPSEIIGGSGEDVLFNNKKVISSDGHDLTDQYITGAREVLRIAKIFDINAAILKDKSPSCGFREIYDGSFNHIARPGMGVTSALLIRNNIKVYSEREITKELLNKLLL